MGIVKKEEVMPDSTRVKEEVERRKDVVEEKPVGAVVGPPAEEKPPAEIDIGKLPDDALLAVSVPFTKKELMLLEKQRITPDVIRYIVVGACDGGEDEV